MSKKSWEDDLGFYKFPISVYTPPCTIFLPQKSFIKTTTLPPSWPEFVRSKCDFVRRPWHDTRAQHDICSLPGNRRKGAPGIPIVQPPLDWPDYTRDEIISRCYGATYTAPFFSMKGHKNECDRNAMGWYLASKLNAKHGKVIRIMARAAHCNSQSSPNRNPNSASRKPDPTSWLIFHTPEESNH